jgi:hypothetical protein
MVHRKVTAKRELQQLALVKVLHWYFRSVYASVEGPGILPFYCEPTAVGAFAVSPRDLAAGRDTALFRLFVALAMFQARRDVVIMRQQRGIRPDFVRQLTSSVTLGRAIAHHQCTKLTTAENFDVGCDVRKTGDVVDCGYKPGASCHVKRATVAFKRMGDMGKLPTSAWLHLWENGGLRRLLAEVLERRPAPGARAVLLVESFARVHRVGRKLATMFVSAVSTPALAPGLTPWFPEVDGNELVIVDTNVARGVDALRPVGASQTYTAREQWIREQATHIDLSHFHPGVPRYSPRLVQQALYSFCSKSNRVARRDKCVTREMPCSSCAPALCPFATAY